MKRKKWQGLKPGGKSLRFEAGCCGEGKCILHILQLVELNPLKPTFRCHVVRSSSGTSYGTGNDSDRWSLYKSGSWAAISLLRL